MSETPPPAPTLAYAFTARVAVDPTIDLGATQFGHRRIVPILGGEVAGPRLRATVMPGGADWQIVEADGTVQLLARYWIRAEDGTVIAVDNRGIRRADADGRVYFRTAPVFEAPAGPHAWLSRTIFVGTALREADRVVIHFFAVG